MIFVKRIYQLMIVYLAMDRYYADEKICCDVTTHKKKIIFFLLLFGDDFCQCYCFSIFIYI